MPPIHLVIMADDLLARTGLAALIEDEADALVIGQLPLLTEPDLLAAFEPDALVADLGFDPEQTPDRLNLLAAHEAPLLALLPTPIQTHRTLAPLRALPAYGLLPRDAAPAAMGAALNALAAGLVVIDPGMALDLSLDPPGSPPPPLLDPLTPRETEVLQLLAQGLPNKQIAQRLGISPNTVKFHVNALFSKLAAASRTEAVIRASQLGLILL